jgi:Ankyrin repeat
MEQLQQLRSSASRAIQQLSQDARSPVDFGRHQPTPPSSYDDKTHGSNSKSVKISSSLSVSSSSAGAAAGRGLGSSSAAASPRAGKAIKKTHHTWSKKPTFSIDLDNHHKDIRRSSLAGSEAAADVAAARHAVLASKTQCHSPSDSDSPSPYGTDRSNNGSATDTSDIRDEDDDEEHDEVRDTMDKHQVASAAAADKAHTEASGTGVHTASASPRHFAVVSRSQAKHAEKLAPKVARVKFGTDSSLESWRASGGLDKKNGHESGARLREIIKSFATFRRDIDMAMFEAQDQIKAAEMAAAATAAAAAATSSERHRYDNDDAVSDCSSAALEEHERTLCLVHDEVMKHRPTAKKRTGSTSLSEEVEDLDIRYQNEERLLKRLDMPTKLRMLRLQAKHSNDRSVQHAATRTSPRHTQGVEQLPNARTKPKSPALVVCDAQPQPQLQDVDYEMLSSGFRVRSRMVKASGPTGSSVQSGRKTGFGVGFGCSNRFQNESLKFELNGVLNCTRSVAVEHSGATPDGNADDVNPANAAPDHTQNTTNSLDPFRDALKLAEKRLQESERRASIWSQAPSSPTQCSTTETESNVSPAAPDSLDTLMHQRLSIISAVSTASRAPSASRRKSGSASTSVTKAKVHSSLTDKARHRTAIQATTTEAHIRRVDMQRIARPVLHSPRSPIMDKTRVKFSQQTSASPVSRISSLPGSRDVVEHGLSSMVSNGTRMAETSSKNGDHIGPGTYTTGTGSAFELGKSIKGTLSWSPPGCHAWESERLSMTESSDHKGADGIVAAPMHKHIPGPRFVRELPNFSHYDRTSMTDSTPGPGHYTTEYYEFDTVDITPKAPFGSSCPREPQLVEVGSSGLGNLSRKTDGAANRYMDYLEKRIARFEQIEYEKDMVRQNIELQMRSKSVLQHEFEAKLESTDKHRRRVRARHQQQREAELREKETYLHRRLEAIATQKAKMQRDSYVSVWRGIMYRIGIAHRIRSAMIESISQAKATELRYYHAARKIQRSYREAVKKRNRKSLVLKLRKFEWRFAFRCKLQAKRRAANRIIEFLQDYEYKSINQRTCGAPLSLYELVKGYRNKVVFIQRWWRRMRLKTQARICVLMQKWQIVHNKPQHAIKLRSQLGMLTEFQSQTQFQQQQIQQQQQLVRTSLDHEDSKLPQFNMRVASKDPLDYAQMFSICTRYQSTDMIETPIKVKLLQAGLREAIQQFATQRREYETAMHEFLDLHLHSQEAAFAEARASIAGLPIPTLAERQLALQHKFESKHRKPIFRLISCIPEKTMFSIICKAYREQSILNSRQWHARSRYGGTRESVTQRDKSVEKGAKIFEQIKKLFGGGEKTSFSALRELLLSARPLVDSSARYLPIDTPLGASGSTCLHTAAWFRQPDTIMWLIAYGADPNFQNLKGNSPLHLVCENLDKENAVESLSVMCHAGGDVYRRNVESKRPVDMVPIQHKRTLTAAMVMQKGSWNLPAYTQGRWRKEWRDRLAEMDHQEQAESAVKESDNANEESNETASDHQDHDPSESDAVSTVS